MRVIQLNKFLNHWEMVNFKLFIFIYIHFIIDIKEVEQLNIISEKSLSLENSISG